MSSRSNPGPQTGFVRGFSEQGTHGNFYKRPSIRFIQKNIVRERAGLFESDDAPTFKVTESTKLGCKPMAVNVPKFGNLRSAKSLVNLDTLDRTEESFNFRTTTARHRKLPTGKDAPSNSVAKRLTMFENLASSKDSPAKPVLAPKPKLASQSDASISLVSAQSESCNLSPEANKHKYRIPFEDKVDSAESVAFRSKDLSKTPVTKIWQTVDDLSLNEVRSSSAEEGISKTCHLDPAANRPKYQLAVDRKVVVRNHGVESAAPPASKITTLTDVSKNRRTVADFSSSELSKSLAEEAMSAMPSYKRQVIEPTPPPKPPRAIAVKQLTAPPSDGSYGLLVYAVSPAAVRIEQIDVSNKTESSLSSSSSDPELKSHMPLSTLLPGQLPIGVSPRLNCQPKITYTGDAHTKSPLDEPIYTKSSAGVNVGQLGDLWEKKFIRSPNAAIVCAHAHGKGKFVKKNMISNPNYMMTDPMSNKLTRSGFASVDDIGVRPVTRHGSHDMLNVEEPAYADPDALIYSRRLIFPAAVQFDSAGYALPNQPTTSIGQPPALPPKLRYHRQHTRVTQEERRSIQDKVSSAYSILHLNFTVKDGTTGVTSTFDDRESEMDFDLEEHQKRLWHVSNVKQATFKSVTTYEQVKLSRNQRLFEYALIVSLQLDGVDVDTGNVRYKAHNMFSFPMQISATDQLTCHFCFPEADLWQPVESYEGETFSFLLTDSEGNRKYGWCCRYLPTGQGPRLPEAICIVSKIGESHMYNELLSYVQHCRSLSLNCAEEIIQVAYARPLPSPNSDVYIRTLSPDFRKLTFIIRREVRPYFSNLSFSALLTHLSVNLLIQVFAAVILERKIIFCSHQLSVLSSCMATIVALLYPFEWQHTYITVLPSMLLDVVDAPTPYIVGLLSSMLWVLEEHELHEVLVVDLDEGCLRSNVGDEGRVIPKKVQKAISTVLCDEAVMVSDAVVAEAFLRMFIETCGHYDSYINRQQNGEKIFQRELFVKAVSSRSISMFLEWFTQTQMFEAFIMDKLKDDEITGLFEQRILEYREEMAKKVNPLRDMKIFGKKFVGFFRDYGEKVKKSINKDVFV